MRGAAATLLACLLTIGCMVVPNRPQRGLDNVENLPVAVPTNIRESPRSLQLQIQEHDREKLSCAGCQIAIIEVDDQGWYWRPERLDRALGPVQAAADANAIIIVYVHGWQHNAAVTDNNLIDFRNLLEQLGSRAAQSSKPRPVLGLYVGWRGQVLRPPLSFFTFWNRAAAADRIARRSAVDLFARLRAIYLRSRAAAHNPVLITVGHSFGARIVFDSVSGFLLTSVMERATQGYNLEYIVSPVTGYGDLVILVNPAFEAARYERFAALRYNYYYFDSMQKPLMLVVSSSGDSATGRWFPIGRRLGAIGEAARNKEQYAATITALGNYTPYITHYLRPCNDVAGIEEAKKWGGVPSPCYGGAHLLESTWQTVSTQHTPFIVASTNDSLVRGHSGIFETAFIEFLVEYVVANTRLATP